MAIRSGTLRLARSLRRAVGTAADNATRTIAAAWVAAWARQQPGVTAAAADAVALSITLGRWPSPYELRRIPTVSQAMTNAETALVDLSNRAAKTMADGVAEIVAATAKAEPELIASQLPAVERAAAQAAAAANIHPTALEVIKARTGQQITSSLWPLAADATDAMNRELIRGIAEGLNPNDAARTMVNAVQGQFEGGLSRAVNIARTEMLDAYRESSRYAHMANSDTVRGWVWLATLSDRTCASCIAMNGREFPNEVSGPIDHQSGRCARMPVTKSWADLGINLPEPPSTIPDARAWFADQDEATQAQIVGPGVLKLLNAKSITFDDLPNRRENPQWRPSYTPRSLSDLQRIAKQRAAA